MFIAHRGLVTKNIKENTLASFNNAIYSSKYSGFELDIYTSKDKEFIVYHNPLLKGKFIWSYTYQELKEMGIIKLTDVLKLKTNKIILIDIKDFNIDTIKLTKLLNKYNVNNNIYVMSFFNKVIAKFQNNNFKIGVLNYILNSEIDYHYDFIGLIYDIVTLNMIKSFKDLNIEVIIYAINKKDKYLYSNVYYIIDNFE